MESLKHHQQFPEEGGGERAFQAEGTELTKFRAKKSIVLGGEDSV
jgi:hypothetical protein